MRISAPDYIVGVLSRRSRPLHCIGDKRDAEQCGDGDILTVSNIAAPPQSLARSFPHRPVPGPLDRLQAC